MTKPGRNDPCPCGSGRKYKKCCLAQDSPSVASLNWRKIRRTEGELTETLLKHGARYFGPEAFAEAWDEFTLWNEVPLEPELDPEVEAVFLPWFLYNWVPDNAERDEADHLPEMPVALHYLEEQSARLDAYQRRFIEEACSQPYSFFLVTHVDSGEGMSLRDLFIGREIYVLERQASAMLREGAIIFARVVTMDGDSVMIGCATSVIPPAYLNELIHMREALEKNRGTLDLAFLHEYDQELRKLYVDIRGELLKRSLPQIHNTDGDPLQLTKLSYRLECTPREALEALATLSLVEDADELVDEAGFDEQGELVSAVFPWLKEGNERHASWDNTLLGQIRIDGDELTIDVNSQVRAEAIKEEVARRLGERAFFRYAVIESMENMLEQAPGGSAGPAQEAARHSSEALQALPEVQEALREMAARHWERWLDEPLPALKGETPREAANTPSGRERLEALFLQFQQHDDLPQAFSPDVSALRRALGMG